MLNAEKQNIDVALFYFFALLLRVARGRVRQAVVDLCLIITLRLGLMLQVKFN